MRKPRQPSLFEAPVAPTDDDAVLARLNAELADIGRVVEAAIAAHVPFARAFRRAHAAIEEARAASEPCDRSMMARLYDARLDAGHAGYPTKCRLHDAETWQREVWKAISSQRRKMGLDPPETLRDAATSHA